MPEASYRASGLMGTSESGAIVGANPLLCSLLFLGGVGGGVGEISAASHDEQWNKVK